LSPAITAAATAAARRPSLVEGHAKKNNPPGTNGLNGHSRVANGAGLHVAPKEYESDLIVVLDMDECLVHSKFFSSQSAKYAFQLKQGTNGSAVSAEDCGMTLVDTFHITLPDGDWVKVHKRPFLEEFLKHTTSRYETHIFTAAMAVYASPLLDRLEQKYGIQLPNRWYREHCVEHNGMYIKDLDCLNKPAERTVLVDNNPYSFLKNPSNGILVPSFYQDHKDDTLPAVADLLFELEQTKDVRPTLKKKFGLETALRDHGL
jgi:CTD small phosphatase-like protein 2